MFTGIIQAIGRIAAFEERGGDRRYRIHIGALAADDIAIGDSIAVNGVCLTAIELGGGGFSADVSLETLQRTTLGRLPVGAPVNLEKAVTPSTRLGGHFVSGHVDAVGQVRERRNAGRSVQFSIAVPAELARYIAEKGSVCVDGTSLTVNRVRGAEFELNIVPHTLQATVCGDYQAGTEVNIEVDIIARYLERLLLGERAADSGPGLTRELLLQRGFIQE